MFLLVALFMCNKLCNATAGGFNRVPMMSFTYLYIEKELSVSKNVRIVTGLRN